MSHGCPPVIDSQAGLSLFDLQADPIVSGRKDMAQDLRKQQCQISQEAPTDTGRAASASAPQRLCAICKERHHHVLRRAHSLPEMYEPTDIKPAHANQGCNAITVPGEVETTFITDNLTSQA